MMKLTRNAGNSAGPRLVYRDQVPGLAASQHFQV